MMQSNSAFFCAKSLFAASLTLGMLLAPMASHAQTDQKIVMHCPIGGATIQTEDYVIDLVAKTISETETVTYVDGRQGQIPSQYNLSQVTDDQIIWGHTDQNGSDTYTLNRYTGQIAIHSIHTLPGDNGTYTSIVSCQRQQKQF